MSKPFALYKKGELHYIGIHKDEADCWKVALGWPSPEEIEWEKKTNVLICLPVRVIAPADRLGSVRCPRCWDLLRTHQAQPQSGGRPRACWLCHGSDACRHRGQQGRRQWFLT